jgi:hypothetical protein
MVKRRRRAPKIARSRVLMHAKAIHRKMPKLPKPKSYHGNVSYDDFWFGA